MNGETTNNANLLTDSAGTASAGTAITLQFSNNFKCYYADGTNVAVKTGTTALLLHTVGCSGASPVLSATIEAGSNVEYGVADAGNDPILKRLPADRQPRV